MRILFTFVGGHGHFEPLVPIARAAGVMGHEVAFGCAPSMVSTVKAAGFNVSAIGTGTSSAPKRIPLRPLDSEREDRDLRDRFARRAAAYRLPYIMTLCARWQPSVLVIAAGSFVRTEVVGEALNELRAEYGMPPDPELEMLSRYLVLSPFPRSFRDPAHSLPATAHAFRPSMLGSAEGSAPVWSSALPGAPTVYFTLGTIFNMESGDLFARVQTGLRELPINLLVTVGNQIDPAELGPHPANVHVERYISQSSVLPYCDLVVSHGGSGSVIGALAHGLPSVLIPLGADQPLNAGRCAALGVARVLDPVEATSESVRAAAADVISDPVYRRNAEGLRDEIAALPEPEYAVGLLERLAAEKGPVYSA